MKNIRIRILILLLVGLGVLAGGVHALHRLQTWRLSNRDWRRAEAAQREGDFQQAVRYLTRTVELSRRKVRAFALLAELLRYELDRPEEADHWIDAMAARNPKSVQAHFLRGQYLLEQGLIDEAAACADRIEALAGGSREEMLLRLRCAAARGRYAQGRQYGWRLVEKYPEDAQGYFALADLELRAGRRKVAVGWLRQGARLSRGHRELTGQLAALLLDEGNIQEAQQLARSLSRGPRQSPAADYLQARIEYRRENWPAAARGFEQARKRYARQPELLGRLDYWLAHCYGRMGHVERQLEAYRRLLEADGNNLPVRREYAAALATDGRVEQALDQYRLLTADSAAGTTCWLERARLGILVNLREKPKQRDWSEVAEALDHVAQESPERVEVPILRAEVLIGQDHPEEARKRLADARRAHPRQPSLWTASISLERRLGNPGAALTMLKEAEDRLPDGVELRLARADQVVQAEGTAGAPSLHPLAEDVEAFSPAEKVALWDRLARYAFRLGDDLQAEKLARRVTATDASSPRMRLLLLDVLLKTDRVAEMPDVLHEIEATEGQGADWHWGRAVYLRRLAQQSPQQQRLLREALDHARAAVQARPSAARVVLLAAQLHDQLGKREKAVAEYLRAVELGDRRLTTVNRAIQLLYAQNRFAEADGLLRRIQEVGPLVPQLQRRASDVANRVGDSQRALALARKAAADSHDYQDHLWLGQLLGILAVRAEEAGKEEETGRLRREAEASLRQATELAPATPAPWIALVAATFRWHGVEKAEEVLASIENAAGEGNAALLQAQCNEAIGRAAEATRLCQAALRTGGNDPSVVVWAAGFYLRQGAAREASEQLTRLVSPPFPLADSTRRWARRELAAILAGSGRFADRRRALRLVEENLTPGRTDFNDQYAKAQILLADPQAARRDEGRQMLEQLIDDGWEPPPADRFRLAQAYMRDGQWDRARGHLAAAREKDPENPKLLAAQIAVLRKLDREDEADALLEELERIAPKSFDTVRLRAGRLVETGNTPAAIRLWKAYLADAGAEPAEPDTRRRLVADGLQETALALRSAESGPAAELLAYALKLRRELAGRQPAERIRLARLLAAMGRMDEAIRTAEASWKEVPAGALAAVLAGLASEPSASRKDLERIRAIATAARKAHPGDLALLAAESGICVDQQRYDEAEALLRRTLAEHGPVVAAQNNLAVLLALRGKDLDEASRLIREAIETAGPVATLLDSRATVRRARGEYHGALADVGAAIADSPQPVFYFHKALLHQALDQPQAAAEALAQARRRGLSAASLNPMERPAYEELARKGEAPAEP